MPKLAAPILALAIVAACAKPDRPTGIQAETKAPALVQNTVDTDGLPDLIVDSKATQNNRIVRVEDFPAEFCSVQEGGVTPGTQGHPVHRHDSQHRQRRCFRRQPARPHGPERR